MTDTSNTGVFDTDTVLPADEELFLELARDHADLSTLTAGLSDFALGLISRSRDIGIDDDQIWAAVAMHMGRGLKLDLNAGSGRTAATFLATLLMRLADRAD